MPCLAIFQTPHRHRFLLPLSASHNSQGFSLGIVLPVSIMSPLYNHVEVCFGGLPAGERQWNSGCYLLPLDRVINWIALSCPFSNNWLRDGCLVVWWMAVIQLSNVSSAPRFKRGCSFQLGCKRHDHRSEACHLHHHPVAGRIHRVGAGCGCWPHAALSGYQVSCVFLHI